MIRLTDGFDLCTYFPAAVKYSAFQRTFNQGSLITGRDGIGQALWIENCAFGSVQYLSKIDPQSTWGFNMDWQWSSGIQPTIIWYTIGYLSTTLFSLRLRPDGSMDLLGPGNALLVNTVAQKGIAFAPATWYTLELKVTFGTSGTAQLWQNGVLAAQATGIDFGTTNPDTLGFGFSGFGPPGPIIDNYVVWDGQSGDPFTGQYGRQRILSSEPIADLQSGEWTPSTPGPSFAMVDDSPSTAAGSPDGDTTFLAALPTGPDAVFEMAATPCSGLILSLAWNACMRPNPLTATPSVDFVYYPNAVQVVGNKNLAAVGDLNPDAPVALQNYFTYQVPVPQNPATMTNWTDQDIANGTFGVGAAASPQVNLTAFYLEKVIDLTGKPYECGGGPITF